MRLLPTILLVTLLGATSAAAERPNVLFIAVDDLKPLLHCYGYEYAVTPNFDRLAQQGTLFRRAYCQQAVCGPSRVSLLTGRYPDVTGIYSMGPPETHLRQRHPDIVTLPQRFKQHGYHTVSIGKIFDPRNFQKGGTDRLAWNERARVPQSTEADPWGKQLRGGYLDPKYAGSIRAGWRAVNEKMRSADPKQLSPFFKNPILKAHQARPAIECIDVPDHAYPDGKMAAWAEDRLKQFAEAKDDKPFFLAVGFLKPHLPFVAPKKYWDLYQRETLPLPATHEYPDGMPACASMSYYEGETYNEIPMLGERIPDETNRLLLHGYLACTSYIDAQLGKLLDTLHETGLDDNTVVVVWGDHGFHTGDHGLWGKHTNWEQATRSPLIIRAPSLKPTAPSDSLVEFVDIYPTLCELTGLPVPVALDGKSLVPLLDDPKAEVRPFAASLYPRWQTKHQGVTIRTERYRLIAWYPYQIAGSGGYRLAVEPTATELYDYQRDPQETENLSGQAEYREVESELRDLLQTHVNYTQSNQL